MFLQKYSRCREVVYIISREHCSLRFFMPTKCKNRNCIKEWGVSREWHTLRFSFSTKQGNSSAFLGMEWKMQLALCTEIKWISIKSVYDFSNGQEKAQKKKLPSEEPHICSTWDWKKKGAWGEKISYRYMNKTVCLNGRTGMRMKTEGILSKAIMNNKGLWRPACW